MIYGDGDDNDDADKVDFTVFFVCSNASHVPILTPMLETLQNECSNTFLQLLDVGHDNIFFSKRSVIATTKDELSRKKTETRQVESDKTVERLIDYDKKYDTTVFYKVNIVDIVEFKKNAKNNDDGDDYAKMIVVFVIERDNRNDVRFQDVSECHDLYVELRDKKKNFKHLISHRYVLYVDFSDMSTLNNNNNNHRHDVFYQCLKELSNEKDEYTLSFNINICRDASSVFAIFFLKVVFLILDHAIKKIHWVKRSIPNMSHFLPIKKKQREGFSKYFYRDDNNNNNNNNDDDDEEDDCIRSCSKCIVF